MKNCNKKISCEICGQEITVINYSKHLRRHANHPESFSVVRKYALDHDGLGCKFCSKVCKNRNSLCNHERLCKSNPDRQIIDYSSRCSSGRQSGVRKAWNKGLTKETDDRVRKYGETYSLNMRGKPGMKKSDETKKKLHDIAIERGFGGMHRNKNSIIYKDVKLNSSYELAVAKDLDRNSIRWEKATRLFYIDPFGKQRTYTADFYLPDYDVYLDPKNDFLINNVNPALGFTDCEKIKLASTQNNVKILILNKDQLVWDVIKKLIDNCNI